MEIERKCKKCGEIKPLEMFMTDKKCKHGKTHECKSCAIKRRIEKAGSKSEYDKIRYERTKKAIDKLRNDNPELYKIRSYKSNDKKKGLLTTIDIDFCKTEMNKPCVYCGHVDTPCNGLDRIDNSIGHTIDNCVPCCTLCNMTRGDRWSHYDFMKFIAPGIREFRGNK